MIKMIQAKSILATVKDQGRNLFGLYYNMNLYRGCQHGCIYCDSRSDCYGIENFSDILVKENAITLLDKELRGKKKKGTIGTGSMNDPYMPAEKEVGMTRRALETIQRHGFPVHILTKGDLVLRDMDILKDISRSYAAVSFTITAAKDELASRIEPGAPISSKRFAAMRELAEAGIYTGMLLMPTLPHITDDDDNIRELVRMAAESGAKYILAWFGMTMRSGQREYFYGELDKKFPGLKAQYIKRYGAAYHCSVPDEGKRYELFYQLCHEYGIETKMRVYQPDFMQQLSFFGI